LYGLKPDSTFIIYNWTAFSAGFNNLPR
jgi:hypothetical protein